MKSVAWVIADRGKTAKAEEGVDGLGALPWIVCFLSARQSGASEDSLVLSTYQDHPPLSEDLGFAHCFPLQLFLRLTREDGADEPVVLCSWLLLGCR